MREHVVLVLPSVLLRAVIISPSPVWPNVCLTGPLPRNAVKPLCWTESSPPHHPLMIADEVANLTGSCILSCETTGRHTMP
ncbi:hypothetical protein F4824DRAFT_467541 [Ustulina deusta]|nr:hypothetical protein F4824DRAFT_467541 [Ustulina deusta]